MENSNAEYVKRAKLGQADAFGKLVDLHRNFVYSVCLAKCGNPADAQDLAQEAFISAYVQLHQLRDPDRFKSWLFRIVCGVCAMWSRSRKPTPVPLNEELEFAAPDIPVEDELLKQETRYLVSDALRSLPDANRLAATLYYVGEYSCEEIGQFTGTNESIIKARLKRARGQLRNYLFDTFAEDARLNKPGRSLTRRVLARLSSFEKEEIFSHLRALKAVLEYHGERVDWDYLLGVSGEAFSSYFSPGWNYLCRFVHSWDVMNAACNAYGYTGTWHLDQDFSAAGDIIRNSLKRNQPIMAPGINPSARKTGGSETHYCFVVTGMDNEHEQFNITGVGHQNSSVPFPTYIKDNQKCYGWRGMVRCFDVHPRFLADNPLFTIDRIKSSQDSHIAVINSLRRAVQLAQEPPFTIHDHKDVLIYGGTAALDQWSQAMRETADTDMRSYSPPVWQCEYHYPSAIQGLTRRYEVARRSAASYVHTLAETHSDIPSDALIEAANHYEQAASMARQLFELYFDPQEEMELSKAIKKYPKPRYFSCKEAEKFINTFYERFCADRTMRIRGADLISEIACSEKAAVQCLADALDSLNARG